MFEFETSKAKALFDTLKEKKIINLKNRYLNLPFTTTIASYKNPDIFELKSIMYIRKVY